jgi:hypothetical protein
MIPARFAGNCWLISDAKKNKGTETRFPERSSLLAAFFFKKNSQVIK